MLAVNVTALLIYRRFGGFGPFHVAAILSLLSTVVGVIAARALRRRRLSRQRSTGGLDVAGHHYMWMSYSYLGIMAAAFAETATRVPMFQPAPGQRTTFGIVVAVVSVAVFAVGAHDQAPGGRVTRAIPSVRPQVIGIEAGASTGKSGRDRFVTMT